MALVEPPSEWLAALVLAASARSLEEMAVAQAAGLVAAELVLDSTADSAVDSARSVAPQRELAAALRHPDPRLTAHPGRAIHQTT